MLKGLQCIIGRFRTGVAIPKFSREITCTLVCLKNTQTWRSCWQSKNRGFVLLLLTSMYTPNANTCMADWSVVAQDKLHESEASEAWMFCFDNS